MDSVNEAPAINTPWYLHRGYLTAALWQHRCNVENVAKHTDTEEADIRSAIDLFELPMADLEAMHDNEATPDFEDFFAASGITPESAMEMHPIPGMELGGEMSEEMSRQIHEKTTLCPVCKSPLLQTHRTHPEGVFVMHTYLCKTSLHANGSVRETKGCARKRERMGR